MSRKHKILAVNILFLLVAIFVAVNSEIVTAKETEDGWVYNYTEDGNDVVICGYKGIDSDIMIPEKIDNKSVTIIGDDAFFNNKTIESVSMPDSIIEIGNYAFQNTELKSIELSDNLTIINSHAFAGCKNLSQISIPDNVVSIGICAFESCTSLNNIKLSSKLNKLSEYTFRDCTSLISITIPDSVTEIGDWCFDGCESLENIIIPVSIENIGQLSFRNTKWLDNQRDNSTDGFIIINDILIDAGKCSGEIVIPKNVKKISGRAFHDCKTPISVVLPDGLTNVCKCCFMECYLVNVTIPDSVTSIDELAFAESKLKSINIPDSVVYIGDYAFNGCEELEEVTLSSSVTKIGYGAFGYCKFKTITIPNTLTIISTNLFYECNDLETILLPDTIIGIGGNAFYGTKWLDNKRAENSLVIINNMVVDGTTCEGEVVIPDDTKVICDKAFSDSYIYAKNNDKNGITSITIPNSVEGIWDTFENVGKDVVFYVEDNSYAYKYISTNVESEENSYSIKKLSEKNQEKQDSVENDSEYKADSDKDPTPNDNQNDNTGSGNQNGNQNGSNNTNGQNSNSNGSKKDEKTGLSIGTVTSYNNIRYKVDGEDTVSVQGYDNKKVSSITIPDTVSFNNKEYTVASINKQSFANNKKLKKITIGANVTSIKSKAFLGCKNLKTIVIKSKKIKSIGSKAFKGINKKATLYVPKSLKKKDYSKYKKMLKKAGVSKSVKIKKK